MKDRCTAIVMLDIVRYADRQQLLRYQLSVRYLLCNRESNSFMLLVTFLSHGVSILQGV